MMSRLDSLPGRALDLVTQVGEGIKNNVPDRAIKWIETGAALGALKTGTRVASKFVRRNPAVAVATAAGAGLVWYLIRRKQKQAENGADRGQVDAHRGQARQRHEVAQREQARESQQGRIHDADAQRLAIHERRRPSRRRRCQCVAVRCAAVPDQAISLSLARASGNSTMKRAPPPSRSSYQRWPPALATICRASDRPRPLDMPSSDRRRSSARTA